MISNSNSYKKVDLIPLLLLLLQNVHVNYVPKMQFYYVNYGSTPCQLWVHARLSVIILILLTTDIYNVVISHSITFLVPVHSLHLMQSKIFNLHQ